MLNIVSLQGRLVAHPEFRTTTTGKSVCSFKLAVDRNSKDKQADFIPCVAWGKTAEFISGYFYKGNMMVLSGALQSRNYEDKNGNKRTAIEVLVQGVNFAGEKNVAPQEAPQEENADFEEIETEDVPF